MSLTRGGFQLKWHLPVVSNTAGIAGAEEFFVFDESKLAEPISPLLANTAWIEVSGAKTPREELLVLLSFGAEVEHALLVQYLYAIASLDPNGTDLTQQLRWILHNIALQEMAHFVSVQNILLAVGGPDFIHTGRDSFRSASGENPLPFALEAISELTLSEYVLAESPAVIPNALADRVLKMKEMVKRRAGIEPHQVGAFYTQIYWLLQPDDQPRGKLALTPDANKGRKPGWHLKREDFVPAAIIAAHQAHPQEWLANDGPDLLILPVGDGNTDQKDIADIALANVYAIIGQGEGIAAGQNSHFEQFLAALDLQLTGSVNVLPLARTPYAEVGPPPDSDTPTKLSSDYTILWGNLFNIRYTMVPLDIGLALCTPVTNPDRANLVGWAFAGMRAILRGLISQMSSSTLSNLEPCGPTFGLLADYLVLDPQVRWHQYLNLLEAEARVIETLERRPELASDTKGRLLLSQIKSNSTLIRYPFVRQKVASSTAGKEIRL